MRTKNEPERQELISAVRKGWIGLNGMYANELTGLCRPEELLQLFRYGTELGSQCGTPVDSAMISDVPGYTWGTVSAMAQAGIRYFSAAPNFFDRIGTFMVDWQDKPFWWVSPSGNERVLVWVPWTGYAMSHVMKLDTRLVNQYQARLDEVGFPYQISCIRWSGHGDNAQPDPEICEFVKKWNEEYEWPRFSISTTSDAFATFEKQHGHQLPEFKGDLTPYWEDGAGSSALETRMNRGAAERFLRHVGRTWAIGDEEAGIAVGAGHLDEALLVGCCPDEARAGDHAGRLADLVEVRRQRGEGFETGPDRIDGRQVH